MTAMADPPPKDRDVLYARAVEAAGGAISRVALGYEADPDRRRDLVQDMHTALWRSLGRFDGRCSLTTWTWRVAHNVGASHVRRYGRGSFVELQDLEDLSDVEATIDRARALQRLTELIHRLAPDDRQLLMLYLEGLDGRAIADVTGHSASNVATRIHRLKALLARRFQEGTSR